MKKTYLFIYLESRIKIDEIGPMKEKNNSNNRYRFRA